jgi:outer membrane phospholipase A
MSSVRCNVRKKIESRDAMVNISAPQEQLWRHLLMGLSHHSNSAELSRSQQRAFARSDARLALPERGSWELRVP